MEDVENKKEEKDIKQFPIRIDMDLFNKIDDLVHKRKKEKGNRSYSINKYITKLIEKDLKEGSSK